MSRFHLAAVIITLIALPALWRILPSSYPDDPRPKQSATEHINKPDPIALPSAIQNSSLNDTSAANDYLNLQKRFHSGDYIATLEMAQNLLKAKTTPTEVKKRLEQDLPIILVSIGWQKIGEDKCQEAIHLFEAALEKRTVDHAHKGLALCYFKQKEWAQARFHIEKYIDLDNRSEESLRLYATILENLQWYEESLAIWQEIATINNDNEISQKIKSLQALLRAQPQTLIYDSGIFRIEYAPEYHEEILVPYAEILHEGLDEFVSIGFQYPTKPIEVVLYNFKDFHKVFHYGPEWAQGLFDGRMRIPTGAVDFEGIRRILRHELIHALFSDYAPRAGLPSWYSEGLAQRLECSSDKTCQEFIWPPKPGNFLSIRSLEAPYIQLSSLKAKRAYQQSLFLITAFEEFATDPEKLRTLIKNGFKKKRNAHSNTLLTNTGISWKKLYRSAHDAWNNR